MLETCPNVWIDISARVGEFGRHRSERVRGFFVKHQDRILFGSDIAVSDDYLMLGSNGAEVPQMPAVRPFYEAHFRYLEGKARQIAHPSPIQGGWKVDSIGLPEKVLDKVYRLNAVRLLARSLP
jgi:predicted TIM-barrel fold metal-dependent hydrolase